MDASRLDANSIRAATVRERFFYFATTITGIARA